VEDPEVEDPEAEDPEVEDPEAEDPEVEDPEVTVPLPVAVAESVAPPLPPVTGLGPAIESTKQAGRRSANKEAARWLIVPSC
jgi:hypothetical protein